MIKYVFCDVDLTLVNDVKKLTIRNCEVIDKIREKGVKFIPCSGRGSFLMDQLLKDLGTSGADDEYFLCVNGNYASTTNGKILFSHSLPKDTVIRVFETVKDLQVGLSLTVQDRLRCYNRPYIQSCSLDRFDLPETTIDEIEQMVHNDTVYKFVIINKSHQYLEELKQKILEMTDNTVFISYSSACFMEITAGGFNKGTAVRELSQILKADKEEILAIGDNYNDIFMMEEAGYSACPANSAEVVKARCNYIATTDNNSSAVAEILEEFILHK